jgi:hypothetical protein
MDLQQALASFSGTEHYYQHPFGHFVYTDGVRYLAETAGAYWLLDAIASWQIDSAVRAAPVQFWRLHVNPDRTAVLEAAEERDENGQPLHAATAADRNAHRWTAGPLVRQEIEYTDFPLPSIDLWLIDGVLLLPSEY